MSEDKFDSIHNNSSLEKGEVIETSPVVIAGEEHRFDVHDIDKVQRRLNQRHIQMIAIAGTIGTGLFLGSGGTLRTAGPAGALIAYLLVGSVAYSTLCSIGEMSAWAPISGTFPHFGEKIIETNYICPPMAQLSHKNVAARWVDPSLGFALGWNYFYTSAMSIPTEVSACVVLITFWDRNNHHAAIYAAVFAIVICAINVFGVRWFGEAEFCFAMIKISLIIALILGGLIIDLGGGPDHQRTGFRYWNNPGAFNRANLVSNINNDRLLAFINVLVQASFAFQGIELVAIAASETESPRRNIAKAIRRVFWRIVIFYVLGIIVVGMLVAYNDDALLNSTGTAAQSPFVIAFDRAGVKTFPHIINACIFTSAFSAGNSMLFCASRILYGLALRGQAPGYLTRCTKNGLPIAAIGTASAFVALSFMAVSKGAETAFIWLYSLTATGGFFSWFSINLTYSRFRAGLKAQGIDPKSKTYNSTLQPYLSYWAMFWTSFFILMNGLVVFWDWNTSKFLTSYINIPIFLGLYALWKISKRTNFWRVSEMDFYTGIPSLEETELPLLKPRNFIEKIAEVLF